MTLTRAMVAAQKANERQGDGSDMTRTSSTDPQMSSRKRARTANQPIQRASARNSGTLKRIFDLPLEIFNEIASHLTPAELLSLARSNKFFRRMFMSRSSINIWRSSFHNVANLPPCPPVLCEPQYASLLFSKNCSECGARALRRMDANLLVKLCNSCRDEMVDRVEDGTELRRLLPSSDRIFPFKFGYVYLLRRDWQTFLKDAQGLPSYTGAEFLTWYDSTCTRLKQREELAAQIDRYFDKVEEERDYELLTLKYKRVEDIESRLQQEGWSEKDMSFPPETAASWLDLVFQPKPLTDRMWTNLYPKLVRLLKANRTYHEEKDRKMRLNARRDALTRMVLDIEATLPPMVRVTLHAQTPDHSTTVESADTGTWTEDRSFALGAPFPVASEVWDWRVAQELVGPDVSVEEMEPELEARRGQIEREIVGWRDGFQRRALAIWRNGRSESVDRLTSEAGPSASKPKPDMRVGTRRSARRKPDTPSGHDNSQLELEVPTLPRCTVEFTQAAHTTTTNIADLPGDIQILLRADTVFSLQHFPHFYPGISSDVIYSHVQGTNKEIHLYDPQNPSKVERDDNASAVAGALLRRLGRPDATYAEMMVFGRAFSCQRCPGGFPMAWNDLVTHFANEQKYWASAQPMLSAIPSSSRPIFHKTHDLAHPSPCVKVLAPAASLLLGESMIARGGWLTVCKMCELLGVEAQYTHHLHPGSRSNIIEHLMRAHGIQEPTDSVHFQAVGTDWYLSSSDESDDVDAEEDGNDED